LGSSGFRVSGPLKMRFPKRRY